MPAPDDQPRRDDDRRRPPFDISPLQHEPRVNDAVEAPTRLVAEQKAQAGREAAAERPSFRGLLAVAEFRALIAGFLLHLTSGTVGTLVISILVYERTHSPLLSAIALASNSLPHVIGATFLISLADRLPLRRGLVYASLAQIITLSVVALGILPVGGILVIVMLGGSVQPIGTAMRSAALPDILGNGAEYVLGRAVMNMTSYSAQALGYAAGGVFVATVGAPWALWTAVGVSFFVIGIIWFGLKDRPVRAESNGSTVRQTWETNWSLLRIGALRRLLLFVWIPLTLAGGTEALFVPFATRNGGASSLASALFWGATAGNFAGDLLLGRLASPARLARLVLPLALLLAVPLICFAANPPAVIAVILCFISATGVSYQLGLQSQFLELVPRNSRAQAFGLMYSGIPALQGVTYVLAGAIATTITPGNVIALFGLASAVSSLALALYVRMRNN
jgi:hypothetical protein